MSNELDIEDLRYDIEKFIEQYQGTAIGESIKNSLDNAGDNYESIFSIYNDLEERGYV